ncbi:MAG: DUF2339 domain-containing protein [Parvularculaceae bacterium]
MIPGDWLVWVGGVALLLGGVFLVRVAADAGFFGPLVRVSAAGLVGVAMVAAAQWLRAVEGRARGAVPTTLAAPVVAGAGASTIYGAIYAAYGVYGLAPAPAALALLVAAAAGMVGLAVVHRAPTMGALALVGGHLAPFLVAGEAPAPALLFAYVFALTIGGLAVGRVMGWRAATYFAALAALGWPALALATGMSGAAGALAAYLPAIFLAAGLVAGDAARAPIDLSGGRRALAALAPPLQGFALIAVGALAILVLLALDAGATPTVLAAHLAVAVAALALGVWRRGLAPVFAATIPAPALAMAFAAPAAPIFAWGGAFAALYGVGGDVASARRPDRGAFAAAAAFGPPAVLAALFKSVGGFDQSLAWGAGAFALAMLYLAMLERLRRAPGGLDAAPGAASAYALGTSVSAAMAVAMAADGLAMSAGLALQAPAIAWLWRRFRLRALTFSAAALATLATVRLCLPSAFLAADVGPIPVVNWLLPAYLLPAMGFWLAARWFEGGGAGRASRTVQALEGAGVALFVAFLSLEIRHALNEGDLGAAYGSLVEISLQTISWLGVAAFLRWRFGAGLARVRIVAERALLALAAAQTAVGPVAYLNPWWGENGATVGGPPVANALVLFYLAPAVAFALAGLAARRAGAKIQSRLCALAAAFMAYGYAILAVRHGFHAPDLSAGRIVAAESWAYSIMTIAFSSLVLVVGAVRRADFFRYAGLAGLALAIAKVFVVDMASLDGVWRASAFLGLGAALIGVAVFYRRIFAGRDGEGGAGRALRRRATTPSGRPTER